MKTGNPTVDALGELHFEGNVIPHVWYQTPLLRFPDGKANAVAITLLADIVYWYRPTVIRSETSGQVVEVRKKFKGHRLQKDYQKWADHFGFSKRQVQDAAAFLEKAGLITREYQRPTNLTFFEPCAGKIHEITFPDRLTLKRGSTHAEKKKHSRLNGDRPTFQRETSTESTSENVQRTPSDELSVPDDEPEQLDALFASLGSAEQATIDTEAHKRLKVLGVLGQRPQALTHMRRHLIRERSSQAK